MAYITSDNYKELVYSETSEQYLNIIIKGEAINRNYVRNIKVKDDVFDSDVFTLGNATICEWELELDNELVSTLDDFDEVEIEHVLVLSDSTNEVIPLGTYMVQKQDDNTDNYTKYKLYDYMKKFDVAVDFSSVIPCTRYELAKYLCDQCGVPLANSSFINGNVEVATYDNTLSAKTYLVLISERAGGFAKVNRNKQLAIKSFGEVDVHELPVNKIGEYKTDKLRTISKVIYENSIQKFEAGDDTGETVFLTSESIFACSQEEVDNIYNSIKGLQYQSLEVRIWGNPAIDTGDIIKVNGMISFAQKDWSFGNGFYGKYKTTLNKSNKGSNVTKIPAKDKIKRIQATLDEENMKITQLIKDVDGQNSKLASVEQTVNSITQSVADTTSEMKNNMTEIRQLKTTMTQNAQAVEVSISNLAKNIELSNSNLQSSISDIQDNLENGVETLKNTLVTIDINGISVTTNTSAISTLMSNDRFSIKSKEAELFFVGYDYDLKKTVSRIDNLTVTNYFTAGYHRQEKFEIDYEKRTGWFYIEE